MAGDPLTLRLHIRGVGQLRSGRFDDVRSPRSLENLPCEILLHSERRGGIPRREKCFEQPLIAARAGEQLIPGLEFQLFQSRHATLRACADSPNQSDDRRLPGSGSLNALSGGQSPIGAPTTGSTEGLAPRSPAPTKLGE